MNSDLILKLMAIALNLITMIFLSIEDLKNKTVNWIPIAALAAVNVTLSVILHRPLLNYLTGIAPGLMGVLTSFATKGKMGLGDGLLLVSAGLFFDWETVLFLWLVALLLCSAVGIVMMLLKKAGLKTALPFVPFLTMGFAIVQITEIFWK
ncbi:MAG: prepilin peptidase [Lachnospiraceae bacterium]|nr:prepilin peptidase [Lachnospiraceae bacterium]